MNNNNNDICKFNGNKHNEIIPYSDYYLNTSIPLTNTFMIMDNIPKLTFNNINENFAAVKGVGGIVSGAGSMVSGAGSMVSRNPRTALALVGLGGIGIYAGVNNKSFAEGIHETGKETGKIFGAGINGLTDPDGDGKGPLNFSINSIIAGILGISTDQVKYIWYGLLALFGLFFIWKIYKMFHG